MTSQAILIQIFLTSLTVLLTWYGKSLYDSKRKKSIWHELEEKKQILEVITDQLPCGLVMANSEKKIILKNRKIVDYFQLDDSYRVGTLVGFHANGKPYLPNEWPMVRAIETGFSSEEEIFFPGPDGTERVFRFNAAPIRTGSVIAGAVVVVDEITEHKKYENEEARRIATQLTSLEVERSQRLLETLVENMPALILMKDTETFKYLRVNKFAQEALGFTEEELIGKTADHFLEKEEARFDDSMDRATVANGNISETLRHEITIKGKGTRVLHTKKFILNPRGDNRVLVVISHDITDIVAGEKQIIRAREQAEQVAQMKSQFLANMSHEIRTPLNGVIGMTELLMETKLDEQQAKFTSLVQDSGKTLLTIVNDILDFSKIEAGQLNLEVIEFDPRLFFKSQLELLEIRANSKSLNLSYAFDPKLPAFLRGDPGRVGQVLMNLIGNAIKFTQAGEINITASLESLDPEKIVIRFSVADTGIGLSEDQKSRLFKPFMQGDGSTARKFGGTGLGLSISKKLVELMGGEIAVENTKTGAGATFWFTIQFKTVELGTEKVPQISAVDVPRPALIESEKKHVLLAEDNSTNQLLAVALLKKMGYVPHVVSNGLEALEALEKRHFDLILMDCQMPELDGYEATVKIREKEKTSGRHIPIVALTANAMKEDKERCFSVGMDDFVSKPIKRDLLEEVLRNWTTKKANLS